MSLFRGIEVWGCLFRTCTAWAQASINSRITAPTDRILQFAQLSGGDGCRMAGDPPDYFRFARLAANLCQVTYGRNGNPADRWHMPASIKRS